MQLDEADRCRLFGLPERPAVCGSLQPSLSMCGDGRDQAMANLAWLETQTQPTSSEVRLAKPRLSN